MANSPLFSFPTVAEFSYLNHAIAGNFRWLQGIDFATFRRISLPASLESGSATQVIPGAEILDPAWQDLNTDPILRGEFIGWV